MSKMDALRAMREARYEQATARPAKTSAPAKAQAKAPARKPPTPVVAEPAAAVPAAVAPEAPTPDAPVEGLCGHRAISGRTCTREHGHTAKSHRYS